MLGNRDKKLLKVLIVENDNVNSCIADAFLYACGYENVRFARTGKEAIQQLSNDVGAVLININLPDSCGLEICKKLREKRGKAISILALAPKGKATRAKCFKAGANGVMSGTTSFKGFERVLQHSLSQ